MGGMPVWYKKKIFAFMVHAIVFERKHEWCSRTTLKLCERLTYTLYASNYKIEF